MNYEHKPKISAMRANSEKLNHSKKLPAAAPNKMINNSLSSIADELETGVGKLVYDK